MKQETQANETVIATSNGEHPALASPARRRGGGVRQPRNVRCAVCRSVYVGPPIDTCEACSDARDARASVTPNAANTETETAAVRSYAATIELTAEREGISNPFEAKRLLDGRIKAATDTLLAERKGSDDAKIQCREDARLAGCKDTRILGCKDTQPLTQASTQPLTQTPTQNIDRKTVELKLVELGRKYARFNFGKDQAFQLARNVKALELSYGGEFPLELRQIAYDVATERLPSEKRYKFFATFVAAFRKIKKPTMDNSALTALNNVLDMSLAELPEIPGMPLACAADRRIFALHKQMHVLYDGQPYPLSSRIQATAARQGNRFDATDTCELLAACGLIKILDRGKSGKGKGKGAAMYLFTGQPPKSDDDEESVF